MSDLALSQAAPLAISKGNSKTGLRIVQSVCIFIIIYGRMKNEGPGSLSYLQVTFNLYDTSGNLLGNAHAHVEYFGAGQTWHFQADPVPATNYQYFKIAGVMAQ